jgi:hypothetical protein
MSVAVAAAVVTPTNLMVMGPGGHQLPMMLFFVVATFLVPVVWSF